MLWTLSCALLLFSCGPRLCDPPAPGETLECRTPGYRDRDFTLSVPESWDGVSALPLIVAFHGGGGNRSSSESVTCPDGVAGGPECLTAMALARGYAVVRPDGTQGRIGNLRTWNAGGGEGEWQCVSGTACADGVDDIAWFDRLYAELNELIPVSGVYLTGISNGGAISYRLACDRADLVDAIAPVGGANQAMVGPGCAPSRPVPTLHIHGLADPCWPYEGGTAACAQRDGGRKVSVAETLSGVDGAPGWRSLLQCPEGLPTETALPDLADDGCTTTHQVIEGCAAPLELLLIEGGGHTWPGGSQYLRGETIGPVSRDFSGSELILDFFDRARGA